MKSTVDRFVDYLNNGHTKQIIDYVNHADVFDLAQIVDENIEGFALSSKSGKCTLLQRIAFDENGGEVLKAIFNRMKPFKFFLASIKYGLLQVEQEFHFRSNFSFNRRLDQSMDINSTLEFGLSLNVKSNLAKVISLVDHRDRKPFIHFTQKMFCEYFNGHYDKCFNEYLELVYAALHQLKSEIDTKSTTKQVFKSNGELQSYYAKHLVNEFKRQAHSGIENLANRSEFLQLAITRDLYKKFFDGRLTSEETLASVKIAIDNIHSRESFTFRAAS